MAVGQTALKMKAAGSSETLVPIHQIRRCLIPEDHTPGDKFLACLQNYGGETLWKRPLEGQRSRQVHSIKSDNVK